MNVSVWFYFNFEETFKVSRKHQKHDLQFLDVSFSDFRTPSRQVQGQGKGQLQLQRRLAAPHLFLALTLTLAWAAGSKITWCIRPKL